MAARYQHVTDAMRSQVASQLGELIWDTAAGNSGQVAVTVRRDSLAAVLAVAEECVASHHTRAEHGADVLAALADLRSALPTAAAQSETANETKTETKEPAEE